MHCQDAFGKVLIGEKDLHFLAIENNNQTLVFTVVGLRRIRNLGIMMPEVLLQPIWNALYRLESVYSGPGASYICPVFDSTVPKPR